MSVVTLELHTFMWISKNGKLLSLVSVVIVMDVEGCSECYEMFEVRPLTCSKK